MFIVDKTAWFYSSQDYDLQGIEHHIFKSKFIYKMLMNLGSQL